MLQVPAAPDNRQRLAAVAARGQIVARQRDSEELQKRRSENTAQTRNALSFRASECPRAQVRVARDSAGAAAPSKNKYNFNISLSSSSENNSPPSRQAPPITYQFNLSDSDD